MCYKDSTIKRSFNELLMIWNTCFATTLNDGDPSGDISKTLSHYEKLKNNLWEGVIEVYVVGQNGGYEAREGLHRELHT